jgi:recombination associated protein RdgC
LSKAGTQHYLDFIHSLINAEKNAFIILRNDMSHSLFHQVRFKRLKIYQTSTIPKNTAELASALHVGRAKPCGPNQTQQTGWTSPLGFHQEDLVVTSGNYHLLAFQEEKKVLPQSTVNELLCKQIAKIEAEEGMPISKKQKKKLKDDLCFELMPRAFSQKKIHWVILDTLNDRMLVSTTSERITDAVRVLLKRAFPAFTALPLKPSTDPSSVFNQCLTENPPKGWSLGQACVFSDKANPKRAIHIKQQELTEPDIVNHLNHHKNIQSISLSWEDRLQLTLHEDLSLSTIQCLEADSPLTTYETPEDPRLAFDSEWFFMAETLTQCTHQLVNWFAISVDQTVLEAC